jgi:predicted dehydrogenase
MKQILQNLRTGETLLAEVPAPGVRQGCLLVESEVSLVSLGTEKMLVDFGRSSLLAKAGKQPEKVRQVLQKIKTDGLFPTIDAVRAKLEEPVALGYCNVGRVVALGKGVEGFSIGERVVSCCPHAEVVCAPQNLCAKVPENVGAEEAVFTVMGAIGMQGIRLLQPALGESVAVIGLGMVGMLVTRLLLANGCRVFGVDFDPEKLALAKESGAVVAAASSDADVAAAALQWSGGRGADGVIVAASSAGSEPMLQAVRLCRKRGRVVQVGVTGVEMKRPELYEKEITLQVSCSYGPGRYDESYEQEGHDYPYAFVRWTEQRNFTAVLNLISAGKLDVSHLVSHRFDFENALQAYEVVGGGAAMGILLRYKPVDARVGMSSSHDKLVRTIAVSRPAAEARKNASPQPVAAGFLGAGNFTGRTLLPVMKGLPLELRTIVSSGGVSSARLAEKFGFQQASTDVCAVIDDPVVNTVFITTRHNAHAQQTLRSLEAGKHVFVEKPLCLTLDELGEIQRVAESRPTQILMLGFNRRFSPHTDAVKKELEGIVAPKSIIFMVNAGAIPAGHWLQNPGTGGGRIIGEACHYIDLLRYLVGHPVVKADITYSDAFEGAPRDTATLQLAFADNSIGTVHYFSNGNKGFPKERLEVFCGGKIISVDNFRKTTGFGTRKKTLCSGWRQNKGHAAEIQAFVNAIAGGGPAPIPLAEILETSRIAIELSLQK